MINNFVCNGAALGTDAQGQHCFVADESLKSWLAKGRTNISFWYCYLSPFLQKYSAQECYSIMKDPPERIKGATEWLRERMDGCVWDAELAEAAPQALRPCFASASRMARAEDDMAAR